MSKTIEVPRDLLALYLSGDGGDWVEAGHELRALLAAPVVERQEPDAYRVRIQLELGDPELSPFETHRVEKIEAEYLKRIHGDLAEVSPLYTSPPAPVAVVLPDQISCDAANAENAPTFMGEPNVHHSIDWYREGIDKHWKTICRQRAQIETLSESLKFYADRDHYSTDDGLNWDSCSGEPSNILWHEEQPWFVEDGSVARACLDKVKELNP